MTSTAIILVAAEPPIPTSAEVGQRLRVLAYIIGHILAVAIAAALTGWEWAKVAAEATYRAGYATGKFVHNLNDRLAQVVHKFDPHVPSDEELLKLWGSEVYTSDGLDALIAAWEQADPERAAMPDHIYGYVRGEQPAVS